MCRDLFVITCITICNNRNPAGTATSSGIEQRVKISDMPLLKKRRMDIGDSQQRMPENGKPNLTYRFARVMAQPMFDNVQVRLDRGQFIFIKNSGKFFLSGKKLPHSFF